MNIFSFHSRSYDEAYGFLIFTLSEEIEISMEIQPIKRENNTTFPGVRVQMQTEASLETIKDILNKIPDSHEMLQTLTSVPLNEKS